jgi:hypothetical protein
VVQRTTIVAREGLRKRPLVRDEPGYSDFAHGTRSDYAERIVRHGPSRAASLRNTVGSHEPGSWFTVRVDPTDPVAALETAASWGARHPGETCVLVCRLPTSVVRQLEEAGALAHTDVPFQSVFRPESFATVRRHAQWFIVSLSR